MMLQHKRRFSYLMALAFLNIVAGRHFDKSQAVVAGGVEAAATAPENPGATTTPSDPELSADDAADVVARNAPAMGLSSTDSTNISDWIRRTLFHSRKRVDKASLDSFNTSLKAFCDNSGADFGHRHDSSLDLLRFCCEAGWTGPPTSTDPSVVLRDYRDVAHQVLGDILIEIEGSIPAEKKEQWKGPVEAAMQKVQNDLDRKIDIWHGDFLFPAFKEPLSTSAMARVRALAKTAGGKDVMPTYGRIVHLMETRDESFRAQLGNFAQYFPVIFGEAVSFHQIISAMVKNEYWSHYDIAASGSDHGWPIAFALSRQGSTQPSAN